MRGFAAALLFAALLAGAATALGGATLIERVAATILTAGVWFVGSGVVTGQQPKRFPWAVLLAAIVLALFLFAGNRSRWSPESLHVAAMLSYGAVTGAAVLSTVRIVNGAKALLLTFSIATAVFASELLIAPPPAIVQSQWQLSGLEDPQVKFRYAPNSIATNSYPDNPRGYFERSDPRKETWSIETHEGSQARLEHLSSESDAVRVTIPKLVGKAVYNVKLNHAPFRITEGTRYAVRFRVKSDAPRQIGASVGNSTAPWGVLGLYANADAEPEWKAFEFPFVATGSDPSARIFFDLGASETPVELSDIVLHNQSTGKDEPPGLPPTRFLVSYRFNSLGFRGPDRVVPRPEGTHRILVLGDSYAQGVGVHEPDSFSAQLEKRLNAGANRKADITYEVINAGISGYATRQELLSYELFSSKYQPQVVLVTMVFNDDMSFQEEVAVGLFPTGEDAGGLTNLWNRVRRSRRTYDYADSIRALRELDEACRRNHAKLAVVIFTNDRTIAAWQQLASDVAEGLKGTGVPILNLKDALFAGGRQERDLNVHPSDGHPNEVAHAIAAETIERFLKAKGLLPHE